MFCSEKTYGVPRAETIMMQGAGHNVGASNSASAKPKRDILFTHHRPQMLQARVLGCYDPVTPRVTTHTAYPDHLQSLGEVGFCCSIHLPKGTWSHLESN